MSDYTGQQFGNYRLVKLLGRGGFAEVYEGEHVYLQTRAAIKILHAKLADSERAGFLNEAQTIARLEHEHIVRVLEFDVREDVPFLVMEYAPGGTLRERFPRGKAIPLEQILPVVQQISSALQYAHEQRLVHRDVKPDNMLLGAENEVLLSDFGIALLLQSTHMSSPHEIVGTAAYMAPEQIRGRPQPASDQYALAIAVYEWLCGERPFQGTSFANLASQHLLTPPPPLRSKAPHLPLAVEEVVQKALAKDPQQRFASVREFALALSNAGGDTTTSVPDSTSISGSHGYASIMNEMGQERTQYRTPETVAPISATVAAQPLMTQHVSTIEQPAQPKRRSMSARMSILLGGLALLLVLSGVIVHFAFSQTPTTPVVQKNPSTSSQKQGVQDYQKLYLQATSGLPTIEDPLTMPDSLDWLTDDGQVCHFGGGALHIRQTGACPTLNFEASNYAYQVQVMINTGKKVGSRVPAAGLMFRMSNAGTYFMDMTVDGSCEFGIATFSSAGKQALTDLIPRHACPVLHTDYHQTNLLTAIASGPNIYLYINKQFVGSHSDGSLASGQIGVFASGGALDTSFRDARVWNLG